MKTHISYECEICHYIHDNEKDAIACEKQGIPPHPTNIKLGNWYKSTYYPNNGIARAVGFVLINNYFNKHKWLVKFNRNLKDRDHTQDGLPVHENNGLIECEVPDLLPYVIEEKTANAWKVRPEFFEMLGKNDIWQYNLSFYKIYWSLNNEIYGNKL